MYTICGAKFNINTPSVFLYMSMNMNQSCKTLLVFFKQFLFSLFTSCSLCFLLAVQNKNRRININPTKP